MPVVELGDGEADKVLMTKSLRTSDAVRTRWECMMFQEAMSELLIYSLIPFRTKVKSDDPRADGVMIENSQGTIVLIWGKGIERGSQDETVLGEESPRGGIHMAFQDQVWRWG